MLDRSFEASELRRWSHAGCRGEPPSFRKVAAGVAQSSGRLVIDDTAVPGTVPGVAMDREHA